MRTRCDDCGVVGLRSVGRHQRIDRAEHAVHPIAGAAAQAFAAYLDSGARSAVHARQEQLVHFDDLIEQRLASLDQRAGDKRVTLGLGETSEVAGIVAAPQLTELTHNPRIEIIQPGAFAEQLLDQAQAHDIAFDTRPIIRA